MLKKNVLYFTILLFIFLPLWNVSAETSNVGFIPANIWYSKYPFEEGDKIKIYTLVFNPDTRELAGTVLFFDDTTLLGKKSFTVEAKGVKDVYIDWTATVGKHTIFGKIENAKFLLPSGQYENISLSENETEKSLSTVQKKIILTSTDENKISIDMPKVDVKNSISNITSLMKDKIPAFISEPVASLVNNVEDFRKNTSIVSDNKKDVLKKEVDLLKINKNNLTTNTGKVDTNKPFKQVELFFFTLLSFILKSKILFYCVSIILIFLLVRFLIRIIF